MAALPVLPSSLLWAVAFGAAASARGLVPAVSVAMSSIAWSGTAQMAVLTLLRGPVVLVFGTSLLVSLRFVPMTLALGVLLEEPSRWRRALAGCLMVDPTFALLVRQGRVRPAYFVGASLVQWAAWVLGTGVGALATPVLPARTLVSVSDALIAAIFSVLALQACADRRQAIVAALAAGAAAAVAWTLAGW